MRIVILVHNLTGGGAERVAALWAKGFYDRGNQVCVIISNPSPITYTLPDGVLLKNTFYQHKNKLIRLLGGIVELRKYIKKFNADVVIEVAPSWIRRFAMIGIKVFKVSTEHWSFERPKESTLKPKKINKIYLNKLYDIVTVLSQADKDIIGNQLKKVFVLPNPLAIEVAQTLPKKEKIVLATGRLDGWHVKGFDILIKSWAKIAADSKGWKLQIVGDSKEDGLKYLVALCADYKVMDSVEFVGYQSNILPFYQNASIFVLSSRYEGFGLVLIEAMSQGCACVACDFKGRQREIITSDKQGVICEPENIEQLSQKMLELINDEEKRIIMGRYAIERAKDFSLEHIMDKWDIILNKI